MIYHLIFFVGLIAGTALGLALSPFRRRTQ